MNSPSALTRIQNLSDLSVRLEASGRVTNALIVDGTSTALRAVLTALTASPKFSVVDRNSHVGGKTGRKVTYVRQ